MWITRYFLGILFVAMLLAAAIDLHSTYVENVDESEASAIICAENVTRMLDLECSLDQIVSSPDDEIIEEAREILHEQCTSGRMDYIYIYTVDKTTMTRYYYVCGGYSDKENEIAENEFSRHTRPIIQLLDGEEELLAGGRGLRKGLCDNRYGDDIVWIYPYYGPDGKLLALIGMDYNVNRLIRDVASGFMHDIIPFSILLVLSMLILLYYMQHRIVSPIKALSDSMQEFARDTGTKPQPLNIHSNDEIGEIAQSYEKMADDIISYVGNIEALTREKLENDVQLGVARGIQNGMVPEKFDFDGAGFSISAMTRPAKAVGGDFYEARIRDDGSVCLVMGDVSGKGISAAICMAMMKTAIKEEMKAGLSPAEILNRANEELCDHNPENLFVTAFTVNMDPATGTVVYANAGHTYPVLIKDDPELLIPESGTPLGLFEDTDIKEHTMTLLPGQGIILYTDGVTEAVNPHNQFFGTDRLLEAVKCVPAGTASSKDYIMEVSRKVGDFCEGNDPFDDMAVLVLLRQDTGITQLSLDQSSFEEVKKAVFSVAGKTKETRRALLACDEALTNIIRYSQATELEYSCSASSGLLRVVFSDNGIEFDPVSVEPEDKEFELLEHGGMGLRLMRQTAESMHYERSKDRNILTLDFKV